MATLILKDLETISVCCEEIYNIEGVKYNSDNQSLVLKCVREKDEEENEVLQISFKHVKHFNLPVSSFHSIDEITVVPEGVLEDFLPSFNRDMKSENSHSQCYRFWIEGAETDFYVYCAKLQGELILHNISYTLYYTNNSGELIYTHNGESFTYADKKNKDDVLYYRKYKNLEEAKKAGRAFINRYPSSICHLHCGDKYELILRAEQNDFELAFQKNKKYEAHKGNKDYVVLIKRMGMKLLYILIKKILSRLF